MDEVTNSFKLCRWTISHSKLLGRHIENPVENVSIYLIVERKTYRKTITLPLFQNFLTSTTSYKEHLQLSKKLNVTVLSW